MPRQVHRAFILLCYVGCYWQAASLAIIIIIIMIIIITGFDIYHGRKRAPWRGI